MSPNLTGIFEALPAIPKLQTSTKTLRRATNATSLGKNSVVEFKELEPKATRRLALGLSTVLLFANSAVVADSLAEDNGYWQTGPIQILRPTNKIDNEETGTRSFLKRVYVAEIGPKGRAYRLRKTSFDLLGLADMIGQDKWRYFNKYLCLKASLMYYDFDKVISAAPSADEQQSLLNLANNLFDNFEKLQDAVKKHKLPETESYYGDTTAILQEVMARMPSSL